MTKIVLIASAYIRRSTYSVNLYTMIIRNLPHSTMNDIANIFVLAIAGGKGKMHGLNSFIAVCMHILFQPQMFASQLEDYDCCIPRRVLLASVQGDTPAMAEILNRCGYSAKQACFKCQLAGHTVSKKFDIPRNSATTPFTSPAKGLPRRSTIYSKRLGSTFRKWCRKMFQ